MMLASFARAFLHQAVDLVDHPEHPPGWAYEDEGVVVALSVALVRHWPGLRVVGLEPSPFALLASAGFADPHEAPRTWAAPVRLVLGTKG